MADLGTVKIVSIDSEMRSSYLDYAMSVIVQRALPDVRDGLKPVQRRILYAMFDEGLRPGTPYRKSAGAVGEVLKKYHPHGETAVYDALVRMVQDFVMRYPLVDGQGNFGCFTGDTKLKLLDGTERSFAELAGLPPDEIFHVYAVDAAGRIVIGDGRSSRITRRQARVIELTFDDGSTLRCTPDHRFMLRDGAWKQAQHLTIDDSLMAGYFTKAPTYFDSVDEQLAVAARHNHRVVAIHWLDELADVYDITVDEHHNFMLANGCVVHNSMDGDSAAAMRYTECRLAQIALELLADIESDTVDFRPNYDDREREPTVLPSRLPNLLLNGVSGIAVGMATNIPPHNLAELCDGISHLIDHPDATVEDLADLITGPDFPTGGVILGRDGILQAYATGRGRVVLRAKAHTEEARANRWQIVVTEMPYMVNKATLLEKIAALVKEGRLEGISDLRDESDRSGIRVVIELKREAQPTKVLNNLYKHTPLQIAFGVNMLALVDGKQPRVLTLKMVLHHYIEHRQQVITRRTQHDLRKARERAHILEGLRIALDHLDAVITTIRESRTVDNARRSLMTNHGLTEPQAVAILDLQLRRLAALERKKIEDEYTEVQREIRRLEGILADPRQVLALIKADMKALKDKYGDGRRSRIIAEASGELSDDDLIPDVGVLVTVTERGYIKRLPPDTYRAQHRGGRGVNGMTTRETDTVQHIIGCNTMDSLLFFTNRGRVFVLRAHELPDASRTAKGTPIINYIAIQPDERVTTLLAVPDVDTAAYLVMCTRDGTIKRTALAAYSSVRANGLIAINLEAGDELLWVRLTSGKDELIISTRGGKAIRFSESDVRPMGRTATGVTAIKLAPDDQVAAMDVVDLNKDLLVVTEFGHGKRTPLADYPLQGRAGQGVITMKLTPALGKIISARVVDATSHLMLISSKGTVIRIHMEQVRQTGRATQGVRLMRLGDGDRVAAVEPIEAGEVDDDGEPSRNGQPAASV